jgi:hypothetical protein
VRTTTVTRISLTRDGTLSREIAITLPWSPGFGTEKVADDRQPQPSQKRTIEPRHGYEHKRRQPST